jgi:hypothetical protein
MWFWEGEKRGWTSPGFFMRVAPKRLIFGAGMHAFDKDQLARFREKIVEDRAGKDLVKRLASLKKSGYEVGGASRKTVPKGFDSAHPHAHLLLHEGLWAEMSSPLPPEIKSTKFVSHCEKHAKKLASISEWLATHVVA